jgi:hypothetical protein
VINHPDVEAVNTTAPNGFHLEMNRAAAPRRAESASTRNESGTSISKITSRESRSSRVNRYGMDRLRSGTAFFANWARAMSNSRRCAMLGYAGWIVVEQDVLPGMGTPRESAQRNREYLRTINL